jgi:hypothetical protein
MSKTGIGPSAMSKETIMSKKETKRMEECLKEAEIVTTFTEIASSLIGIRYKLCEGQCKVFGYYAFLDPSNGKKTFVRAS